MAAMTHALSLGTAESLPTSRRLRIRNTFIDDARSPCLESFLRGSLSCPASRSCEGFSSFPSDCKSRSSARDEFSPRSTQTGGEDSENASDESAVGAAEDGLVTPTYWDAPTFCIIQPLEATSEVDFSCSLPHAGVTSAFEVFVPHQPHLEGAPVQGSRRFLSLADTLMEGPGTKVEGSTAFQRTWFEGAGQPAFDLEAVLAKHAGVELPNLGSAGHASGTCDPCAFFHVGRCTSGPQCRFCHLCDEGARKRLKKSKLEMKKARRVTFSHR